MRFKSSCVLLSGGPLLLILVGCGVADCFFPLSQEVSIQVTSSESGASLSDAQVTMAPRDRPFGNTETPLLSDDEYLDEFDPASGLTNDDGGIVLPDERFEFCGSGFFPFFFIPRPLHDPLPDYVTGNLYLVRVETDHGSEILTVQLTPGQTVAGELYAVEVLSVSETIETDPYETDE